MEAEQYLLYSLHDHPLIRIESLFNNQIGIHLPSRRHPPQLKLIHAINDQDETPTMDPGPSMRARARSLRSTYVSP